MASNDELYDEWENDSAGGAPAISWKFSDVGDPATDTFTGIVVPPDPITAPAKGYAIVKDSNKDGFRVWPPRVGYVPKPNVKANAPISESEYLALTGGDDSDMRYVTLTTLTLVTEYANKQFFSSPQKKRALEDPEFVDDGLRRFIVDGKDIPPKFKAAVQKLRTRGTQPGQRLTVQIIAREPNTDKEGETNRFKITLEPPTPETMAVVKKYIEEAKAAYEVAEVDDPWAGTPVAETPVPAVTGAGAAQDEAPPF